jgi:hypothetical protein
VRLGIVEARVLAIDDLLMGFLGRWWHIVVEADGEVRMLVVVGIEGVGFGNMAEVGVGVRLFW